MSGLAPYAAFVVAGIVSNAAISMPDGRGEKAEEVCRTEMTTGRNGPEELEADAVPKKGDAPADEFGLPSQPPRRRQYYQANGNEAEATSDNFEVAQEARDLNRSEEKATGRAEPVAQAKCEGSATNAQYAESEEHERDEPKPAGLENDETDASKASCSSQPNSSHKLHESTANAVSEWSHQQLAAPKDVAEDAESDRDEWQDMPALATHRIYDDWGKVLAKEYDEVDDEKVVYDKTRGAGKGYTRVQVDDDAQSATSMDDNTAYLFKDQCMSNTLQEEDEEGRDLDSQMQTTKEMLTEGQRIAYVGVVKLSIGKMMQEVDSLEKTQHTRKQLEYAQEHMKMWGQKTMVRLYGHMQIDSQEQIMIEQLAEHMVLPSDLTPVLMQNARVKNPAKLDIEKASMNSVQLSTNSRRSSEMLDKLDNGPSQDSSAPQTPSRGDSPAPPPAYEEHTADQLTVQDPLQIENKKDLDLDIRWTVLCDLFLLLIADSYYDSRSRTLLEIVGAALSLEWQEICRFEKRVTDALYLQEQADKENWNEDDHLEMRRKAALKKRLMVMGLCTAGGSLIIGLSAGLLAPVIGAGLAAGFTAIGVGGTSTFLGGTAAAALIGGIGTATGGIVGVQASNRRTGAVKTFEYRPLHNNKRTNLIITVSGWMTGKVDDVRLPFSTIDPIMGDVYSVHWEPEMLQSTGQTINILAREALTQTIQQILADTFLTTLMAGLSLPIVLTKLSYLIDNPWTVSLVRADASGLILADSLIDRNLGVRPVTLVGFSLGSRVVFSCLKELARRGAVGLVQNVYLFGSPIVAKKDEYLRARSIVSGRFVNGYATNDWILGYLFRATSGGLMRVSGLSSVDVTGVENKDVTKLVPGHMAYRGMMPLLLQEVGWVVESLEFTEVFDPDPDDHEKRQRELIREIDAARAEMDEKAQKKSGFKAFFSRKKAPQKKVWETYNERSQKVLEGDDDEAAKMAKEKAGVTFDVDAIRQEMLKLAVQEGADLEEIKQHIQIREIESTMPALKLTSSQPNGMPEETGFSGGGLRQTKSLDGTTSRSSPEPGLPHGHAIPTRPSNEGNSHDDGHNLSRHDTEENMSLASEASERSMSTSGSAANGHASHRSSSVRSSHSSDSNEPYEPPQMCKSPKSDHPFSKRFSLSATSSVLSHQPSADHESPDHGSWTDEEDDVWEEKEVSMSFE